MASTKAPTGKTNGGNGSARLPSTRERRPALAALAVLLILGGALASAWLAMRAGHRAEYVQVNSEIGQGQEIKKGDLTTVELPEDFEGGVPESDIDDIVGQRASTPWTEGMVVMDSMVTDEDDLNEKLYRFAVPVESALVPELSAGTNVAVYTGGSDSPIAGTVAADAEGAGDATSGESSDASVLISVPASCGSDIASARGDDTIDVGLANVPDTPEVRSDC